jgi:ABC-type multidrug transport system fused ATPase/permease subunit
MLITVTIVDPIMAVISVLLGFIVVKFGYFRMHKIASKLGHDHAKLNVSANSEFLNLFNSYREFFVRNQVETQLDKFNSRQKRLAIVNGELSFLPSISKYVVEGTVILSALLISASQFVLKDASQAAASLSIFFAASTRVAPAAMRVQQSLIQIQSSSAISQSTYTMLSEIKDFKEITIAECKSEACDGEFVPKVDINDLHFRYLNSPETVINILNLSVRQGESFGIVGPSGSGKSTLADLILGLLEPDSGSIQISGVNPSCALNRWPGKIGYVPQEVQILDGTIRENIVFGSTVVSSDDTLLKLLHLVQLSDLVSSSEELNSQVGENGSRLSGGQRQRLGIARALYTNPSLLILDEISSALDAETESAITSLLESLKGHVTIILIAHRLSTVRNCTKIAYLSEGEIVGVGSFNELRLQIKEFDHQARLMGL